MPRRVAAVALVGLVAAGPVGLLGFVGAIVGTDCLLGCGDSPRPLLGSAMWLGASACVAAWAAAVAWAVGRGHQGRWVFAVTLVGLGGFGVLGILRA